MTSQNAQCCKCRFYEELGSNTFEGECRRYAPRPDAMDGERERPLYPHVIDDDWCGEYEFGKARQSKAKVQL